jgi:hypothetical protein
MDLFLETPITLACAADVKPYMRGYVEALPLIELSNIIWYTDVDTVLDSNESHESIVWVQTLPDKAENKSTMWLLNTEIISRIGYAPVDRLRKQVISGACMNYIDYSVHQAQQIKMLNKHTTVHIQPHFPIRSVAARSPTTQTHWDVVFFGCMSPRRSALLTKVKAEFSCLIATDVFGIAATCITQHAKVVLNLHFDEKHTVFEQFRVMPALCRGANVVSEPSIIDEHHPLRQHVHWIEGGDIISAIRTALSSTNPSFDLDDIQKELLDFTRRVNTPSTEVSLSNA